MKKMSLFVVDSDASQKVKGKYIYLDNDFLGKIYKDEDVFKDFIDFSSISYLLIDPFTEFEFLRDIYVPTERILREKFIKRDIFLPVFSHQDIFKKIQINALILSKIYAHQRKKNQGSSSLIDLFLAARLMYQEEKSVLITGNKKDFPSCIFDVLGVINIEEGDSIRAFCLVNFNRKKFQTCHNKLLRLEKEFEEELKDEFG